jgi:hypothetical protein
MRHVFPALALAALTLTVGCGDSPSSPAGNATLTVRLTDSPFSDAKAVLVTFSAVSLHRTDGGFTTLPLKLEGPEDVLGTVNLPAGDYTQIRLTVSAATLYFDNAASGAPCEPSIQPPAGASAPVTVPSGTIRLNRPFELLASTATTVLLDFDGNQSIHQTGNGSYTMNPVVSVLSVQ